MTSSLFGNNLGNNTRQTLFGAQSSNIQNGLFSNENNNNSTTSPSLFGTTINKPKSPLFGANNNNPNNKLIKLSSTGSLFGNDNNTTSGTDLLFRVNNNNPNNKLTNLSSTVFYSEMIIILLHKQAYYLE